MGISVDSKYSHAAFAAAVGGIRYPLLADFHPKGAVAESFGLYLEQAGITDRATVLIDAGGTIRHISSVTPAGKRDMTELLRLCQDVDAAWEGEALAEAPTAGTLPDDAVLYVRDNCMFSRWALYTKESLKLDGLTVRNVSEDYEALEALEAAGGKSQAPALQVGGEVMYESAAIAAFLAERCALAT